MNTVALTDKVRFEPVTGTVGAVVRGVDLVGNPGGQAVDMLRRGLHEYGVLFFEFDRVVTASEFAAFGDIFGKREDVYGLKIGGHEMPAALEDQYVDSDTAPMKKFRAGYWHSDGSALERPPLAAMLTPAELPGVGGDTMWASMYAAWEGLSSFYQRLLDGAEVLHTTGRSPFLQPPSRAVHPAVLTDPVTGRKLLFVNSNYAESIVGMKPHESDALLRMLFEHVNTPEFHVRLRWRLGTIAVWQQRVTQHRGVDDFRGPRKLRRIVFEGDRPTA
jgi:taurine dioxygenase